MAQLSLFAAKQWTVTQLTHYLRELLENDEYLQDVWVQGEVSNLSRPTSGHLYFTLKDHASALKCVMWRNAVARQTYLPRDGEAIEVHGSVNIYETAGQYQLYADLLRPAGQGVLFQEFLRLKARLEAEGLFDEQRKRPIPSFPHTIGVITSPTGAAIRDILNTLRRRYPLASVVLAPTQVQGEGAPAGIISALTNLNQIFPVDVIILARGGGSIEDLWAFNDENVARAIASSQAPVISGVGHETDFTIADFVSDLRAPTPTAAAELATPNRADLHTAILELHARIGRAVQLLVSDQRWQLGRLDSRLSLRSPKGRIRSDRQRLDDLLHQANTSVSHTLQLQKVHLRGFEQRLNSLNPKSVLNRGYALVRFQNGQIVHRVTQVTNGNSLQVQVSDGQFNVLVNQIDLTHKDQS
jgi:exodeoxyribonuclease VII large subunit